MKKILSVLVCSAAVLTAASIPASAHGRHHSGGTASRPQYTACTVDGCVSTGLHQHDGQWYCDKSGTASCPRYEVCTAEGCVSVGPHQHDGQWYCDGNGTNHQHTNDHAHGGGHGHRRISNS